MLHAMPAENVLIVGTGKLARYLQQKVSGNPWLNQKVIGSLELPTDGTSGRSLDTGAHLFEASDFTPLHEPNVLGPLEEMLAVIDRHDVRTVYFAVPLGESHRIEDMYFELLDRHVAVHWVPDIFSVLLVNHSVREIAGLPVLTLSETPLTGTRLLLKAVEDFVLASLIGRGGRFFLVAGLMAWGGPRMEAVLRKYVDRLGWATVAAVVVGVLIYRA